MKRIFRTFVLAGAMTASLGIAETVTAQVPVAQAPQAVGGALDLSGLASKSVRASSWQGKRVALRGRDVVSFHSSSGPVKGSKDFVADWDQTKWRFSSEENRALFLKNPEKYAPAFGGYCPVALADKKLKVGRSGKHTVVDGTLYLNNDSASLARFRRGPQEVISQARLHF